MPLSGRNGKGSDLTRLSKQGCPRFAPVLWALTWDKDALRPAARFRFSDA